MTKELDFEAIKNAAESHRADMTRFLRAMISHPSESCEVSELETCFFDRGAYGNIGSN